MKRTVVTLLLLAVSFQSHALLITSGGVTYDLTAAELTLNGDFTILENQDWWGNEALALDLATQVEDLLGLQACCSFYGAAFAWAVASPDQTTSAIWNTDGGVSSLVVFAGGDSRLYATGRIVSVPEPGTLALLGIGLLGMGAARRRRKV